MGNFGNLNLEFYSVENDDFINKPNITENILNQALAANSNVKFHNYVKKEFCFFNQYSENDDEY